LVKVTAQFKENRSGSIAPELKVISGNLSDRYLADHGNTLVRLATEQWLCRWHRS
jgi:hypothetical protein